MYAPRELGDLSERHTLSKCCMYNYLTHFAFAPRNEHWQRAALFFLNGKWVNYKYNLSTEKEKVHAVIGSVQMDI